MKKLFAALMLLASTSLMADPMAGVEYNTTAQNIPTENAAKVEVTELFWYGCGHCNTLEPQLHAWANKLPEDVVFKRVPGLPRPDWAPMAKAYYAMETLGVLEKLHNKLFAAIHKQKTLNPTDEKAAINWVAKEGGLDKAKVEEAFRSFSTNTSLNRAAQIFRASGATGVPSLIIDGKYITSSSMAGGNHQVLNVADYLIAKARTEKK